jgi:hypothetical protein
MQFPAQICGCVSYYYIEPKKVLSIQKILRRVATCAFFVLVRFRAQFERLRHLIVRFRDDLVRFCAEFVGLQDDIVRF